MIAGILILLSGLLIAIFPELLSFIVAFFLMVTGSLIMMIAYEHKKRGPGRKPQVVDFIFRY